VPRVLPENCQAVIERANWRRPAIFDWLQRTGRVNDAEMFRVLNNGIGLVVIVAAGDADRARAAFEAQGETCWRIGSIGQRQAGAAGCVVL
jgi:phosphoribosylformylglycinamidine cyclo-ligase